MWIGECAFASRFATFFPVIGAAQRELSLACYPQCH